MLSPVLLCSTCCLSSFPCPHLQLTKENETIPPPWEPYIRDGPFSYIQVKTVCLKCHIPTPTCMQWDPSLLQLHGMCDFMQWLCPEAACFPVLMKTWASAYATAGECAQVPGLINSVCLFLPAQTLVGSCLDGTDWPCAREVLSSEGSITGSSLGAERLDKEEQREQQRRQRQVKASNMTHENMCLPLSQFEVQVLKLCRLKSLILSAVMRGKSVRQLNKLFFFLIFDSSQLHTGSFLWTCTIPCFPLSCLLLCMLNFQYGVTQRTERLELRKKSEEKGTKEMRKALQHLSGNSPSAYTLLNTDCLSIHSARILCKPLLRMPSA